MHIEQSHSIGQRAAVSRIDHFLERLVQNPPGGVAVTDTLREWDGNRMTFAFTAGNGFIGTTIRGVLDVLDKKVVLEAEVPVLIRTLLGEDRIRQVIARELGALLKP